MVERYTRCPWSVVVGGCGGVGVGVFFGSFSQETKAKRRDIDRTPKNLGCSLMIVCIGVNKKVT